VSLLRGLSPKKHKKEVNVIQLDSLKLAEHNVLYEIDEHAFKPLKKLTQAASSVQSVSPTITIKII
jgi:hypothetical protein